MKALPVLPASAADARAALSVARPGAVAGRGTADPIGQVLSTFRKEIAWVFLLSALTNVLLLTPTIYMLQLFDRVMSSHNLMTLAAVTVFMVVFTLVMGFADWLRSRLLVRAGGRFDEALNRRVFDATFHAQLAGGQRDPIRPLLDLQALRQFLTGNGAFAFADSPWSVVFIVALFMMHPWLGWFSVVFLLVQLGLGYLVQRLATRGQEAQLERARESGLYLQAKLRNAETVESMGMLGSLRDVWLTLNDRHQDELSKAHDVAHRIQALMKWLQYTQQALMLSLGALLVMKGQIGVGAMVASNALMGNAVRPMGLIVQIWPQFVEARSAYRRLGTVLAQQPVEPTVAPRPEVGGQVTLRDLSATVHGREQPILRGLNADFRAGEVVAIIGPSGAGKSTLARCLLGIWPQTEGAVLIDGHPVHAWPRDTLGPRLGYLPQDVELFEGTIADNIGRFADVEPELVIEAAQAAGIHDMVLRMADGYDTPIGEAGGTLSGGQRQRLGLARAVLGRPAIVVLDEPSANLDDAGEAALLRAVAQLKAQGSTVFMIVHQQHLLAAADRALVLEAGQIVRLANIVRAPAPAPAQTSIANPS